MSKNDTIENAIGGSLRSAARLTTIGLFLLLGGLLFVVRECAVDQRAQREACFERCGGSAVVYEKGGCNIDGCLCVHAAEGTK